MPRPSPRAPRRTRRRIPDKPRFNRAGPGADLAQAGPPPLESEGIGGYGVDPAQDPAATGARKAPA